MNIPRMLELPVVAFLPDGGKLWRLIDGETECLARDLTGDLLDGGGISKLSIAKVLAAHVNAERGVFDGHGLDRMLEHRLRWLERDILAMRNVPPVDEQPLWVIEDGGFAYRGKFYRLARQPLQLLKVFVSSRHQTVGRNTLLAAWDERNYDPSSLRTALCQLRRVLRNVAADAGELLLDGDPLPRIGEAWGFRLPRVSSSRRNSVRI